MIGTKAPEFTADCYKNGEITKLKLGDYKGRWVVLFFYPADFTFVCPTELEGFANDYEKFIKKEAEIIAVSSEFRRFCSYHISLSIALLINLCIKSGKIYLIPSRSPNKNYLLTPSFYIIWA